MEDIVFSTFKIFGIGLPKTGNTSLTHWLRQNGLRGVQFPSRSQWLNIENYDFVVDTPCNLYYPILYPLYPEGIFIYTYRNEKDWQRSYFQHLRNNHPDNLSDWQRKNRVILNEKYGYIYQHWEEAKTFFKHRPNFFELNIDAPNIENLKNILGFKKNIPFPKLNQSNYDNS